jgi:D-alanyl-D-alanine carboxypeptidase
MAQFPSDEEIFEEAPGSVFGVWKKGRVFHEGTTGIRNIFSKRPMRKEARFRIGSLTKTFTATVVLKLVSKGLIDPKKSAYSYFSRRPSEKILSWLDLLPKTITVEQLGTMTSGLYNFTQDLDFNRAVDADPEREWTPEEILLNYSLNKEPYFEPREGWYYCNTNYLLLGLLAEHVSGHSLEVLYDHFIFKRLGMKNTFVPHGSEIDGFHADGYMYGYEDPNREPKTVLRQVTRFNPSWAFGSGNLVSNLDDLRVYINALGKGLLIGEKGFCFLQQSYVDIEIGQYGFGLFRYSTVNGGPWWVGHTGQIHGYQSSLFYNSCYSVSVAVLTNIYSRLSGIEPALDVTKKIFAYFDK